MIAVLGMSAMILTGCWSTPDVWSEVNAYGPTVETDGYSRYNESDVQAALDAGKNVVIFFGATRCPPCIALGKDLEARADEIPDNVAIFAADYDLDEELKAKYEVTQKHTSIYLAPDGSVITKNTAKEHKLEHILDGIENAGE